MSVLLDSRQTQASGSLTEATVIRLRRDIVEGILAPGAKLRIGTLAEQLGVNPGAVREALSRLTAESLVTAKAQYGFRVSEVSADELRDITWTRIQIESIALRESMTHGSIAWEGRIFAALHELSRTPTYDDMGAPSQAWATAHGAYHSALVAGCLSPWLLRIRELLFDQSERYRRLCHTLVHGTRDIASEHQALAQAVVARDLETASRILNEHFSSTTETILDWLSTKSR